MNYNFELNLGPIKISLNDIFSKNKKISKQNIEIIQSRIVNIIEKYKPELDILYSDILDEMKNRLYENEVNNKNSDFINKIEVLQNGDISEEIDDIIEKYTNNDFVKFVWNNFFYNEEIKELENKVKLNFSNFKEIFENEINNYFNSKTVDLPLLLKEKDEIISLLKSSIYKFEKMILFRLRNIMSQSIINQMKTGNTIDENKNVIAINNINRFADDIENGSMNKYYERFFLLIDKIITESINKIEK